MTVYLHKGEKITCENGHVICEAAVDIDRNSTQDSKRQLTNWQQPEPKGGTPLPLFCTECGALWAHEAPTPGSVIVHTETGWR